MIAWRGVSPGRKGTTRWSSCHAWSARQETADPEIRLGHPLLDEYLVFVAARARTNTWLAVAFD